MGVLLQNQNPRGVAQQPRLVRPRLGVGPGLLLRRWQKRPQQKKLHKLLRWSSIGPRGCWSSTGPTLCRP